jgi:hypothetical protein
MRALKISAFNPRTILSNRASSELSSASAVSAGCPFSPSTKWKYGRTSPGKAQSTQRQTGGSSPRSGKHERERGASASGRGERGGSAPGRGERGASASGRGERGASAPGRGERGASASGRGERGGSAPGKDQSEASAPGKDQSEASAPARTEAPHVSSVMVGMQRRPVRRVL